MIPLGCLRDPKDPRDILRAAAPTSLMLPDNAEVPSHPPIQNQGQRQSCTGHALAWMLTQTLCSRGMPCPILSPSFPWFYARAALGQQAEDTGCNLRIVFEVAHKRGVPPVERWEQRVPYDREPDSLANSYAQALRIPRYERCDDLREMQHAIAIERQSVVVGTTIFERWAGCTGRLDYDPRERSLGGHAFVLVGYDDMRQSFRIANSWGETWGDGGYAWLPYEHLRREWFDAWTVAFDVIPDATR